MFQVRREKIANQFLPPGCSQEYIARGCHVLRAEDYLYISVYLLLLFTARKIVTNRNTPHHHHHYYLFR